MLLSLSKNGLTSLFKEVRVFKDGKSKERSIRKKFEHYNSMSEMVSVRCDCHCMCAALDITMNAREWLLVCGVPVTVVITILEDGQILI